MKSMLETAAQGPALRLAKSSLGVGDRFGHQAGAQLQACMMAARARGHGDSGVEQVQPGARDRGLRAGLGQGGCRRGRPPHGVGEAVSRGCGPHQPEHGGPLHRRQRFLHYRRGGRHRPAGAGRRSWTLSSPRIRNWPAGWICPASRRRSKSDATWRPRSRAKYLFAAQEAGRIYRHIAERRNGRPFITEVSMDETDEPQTPPQLLVILAALADEGVPAQTIAPKFSGRFNKGVDYVGDVAQFEREFQRRPGRHRLRRAALWASFQPQAQRAFRQRQVLHLRAPSGGRFASSTPACTSRPPAPPGWKS